MSQSSTSEVLRARYVERVLKRYNWGRTETSESLSHEPRARQFSAVLVPGRVREWDCARGGGFDRLNVFPPAARLSATSQQIDAHEKELGVGRPYRDRDPPHVGPIDGKEYIVKRGLPIVRKAGL